ncbi:MAG: class I SAM-dependent methyltransferase [bacterium]|nr:class I SAM-dependent methyltransferase [bacterium]
MLDPHTDFIVPERNWWDYKYAHKLGHRYATFRMAFVEVLKSSGPDRACIETGCVREANDYGAGYSTMIIAELISWYGGSLQTVDLNPKHIALCKKLTEPFSDFITYHVGDSVAFLKSWSKPIDFLYLDSYDYPQTPKEGPIEPSQRHCLAELEAALPQLRSGSIVLIDDARMPGGGKPGLAKHRLVELGAECLLDDYQLLWRMP